MMEPSPEFGMIHSTADLEAAVAQIRTRHRDSLLLYRGQTNLYASVRSGRRRPDYSPRPAEERGWVAVVGEILERHGGQTPSSHKTGAILQHYGLPTNYVDLTAQPRVAAWFACNQYHETTPFWVGTALRMHRVARYERLSEGIGFVLVLVAPLDPATRPQHLYDLSQLPAFVRPHRQHGWLLYDRAPILPEPTSLCRYVLRLDRKTFCDNATTQPELFPAPKDDPGYAELLSVPHVQIPGQMLSDLKVSRKHKNDIKSPTRHDEKTNCFAMRLISVPEYGDAAADPVVDHKWDDVTIFEPHHMRVWYRWRFDIGSVHAGLSGDIAAATKVTLAPWAMDTIREHAESTTPRWLELGSDGNFFTFAEWDHDKVIEHGPPYHGVWLQRQDDLVVELPMTADEESLTVLAGHVYLLWDGNLRRQSVENSCGCDQPESHDARVKQVLSIPDLVDRKLLKLVPHPLNFPRWFVVW